MKKIVLLLLVIFSTNAVIAQSCKKSCKDKFVINNGLIEATLYHDNGTVAQTGFYTKENKLQGEWTSYDAQGNKTAVAYYDNGAKTGSWKFYQGNTLREVSYSDSKIAEVKTWKMTNSRVVSNNP